jgi:predicted dehydrogenase
MEWDVPGTVAPATSNMSPNGHENHYRDFVDAFWARRPPKVTTEDARAALAVVEAAYESSRTGGLVRIKSRLNPERVPL